MMEPTSKKLFVNNTQSQPSYSAACTKADRRNGTAVTTPLLATNNRPAVNRGRGCVLSATRGFVGRSLGTAA